MEISTKAKDFLYQIIEAQSDGKSLQWLNSQTEKIQNGNVSALYLSFSISQRFFKKDLLILSNARAEEAEKIRSGFHLQTWDLLQVVRAYLLLILTQKDSQIWVETYNKLFSTADLHEQEALYAVIPVLPIATSVKIRALDGLRTNITSVFDAIALNSPYPAEYFEEAEWNQMVLKAIFLQRPVYRIYGADLRSNPTLARMLIDFIKERRAAGRKVTPEIWRFISPYLNKEYLNLLEEILMAGTTLEKRACILACITSPFSQANILVESFPDIKQSVLLLQENWITIGEDYATEILPK